MLVAGAGVFVGVAGAVVAGAEVVTVCDGAVTVFVGPVTVVVSVGFGDWTLTPRLLVVEIVCWLTVVEGELDLLFEAITPASTPSAASSANTGHIQPLRRFDEPCSEPDPRGAVPPLGSGSEPAGGGETDIATNLRPPPPCRIIPWG